DLLTSLIDKSLAVYDQEAGRYRMLETVRQYGVERLMERGETEVMRARHAAYFRGVAEEAAPHLCAREQLRWLDILEGEHDNLRAALDWCAASPDGAECGLRIAAALWRFWWDRGHLVEARTRYAAALNHPGAPSYPQPSAGAFLGAGMMTHLLDSTLQ